MKCQRLFRPQFGKVKPIFLAEIRSVVSCSRVDNPTKYLETEEATLKTYTIEQVEEVVNSINEWRKNNDEKTTPYRPIYPIAVKDETEAKLLLSEMLEKYNIHSRIVKKDGYLFVVCVVSAPLW